MLIGTLIDIPYTRSITRALLRCAVGLTAVCALAVCMARAQAPQTATPSITVTLLGTGTPQPDIERFSASTLVEAGGMRFLFDAGRGATIRLNQAGVAIGTLDATFITHFHSDHINGLDDLWLTGFLPPFGSRQGPMTVIGPTGTNDMMAALAKAFAGDIHIRDKELRLPSASMQVRGIDFDKEGVVFEKSGVRITAFTVDHGLAAAPAYGYRLDYAGHAVLISGDTRYSGNLIKHAEGLDLLVHEVAAAPDSARDMLITKAIMALHTSPEECGRLFTLTKPRLAAYTHVALLRFPGHPPVNTADIEAKTRTTYVGPLVVGSDLTRFEIGRDGVHTLRWDAAQNRFAVQP